MSPTAKGATPAQLTFSLNTPPTLLDPRSLYIPRQSFDPKSTTQKGSRFFKERNRRLKILFESRLTSPTSNENVDCTDSSNEITNDR